MAELKKGIKAQKRTKSVGEIVWAEFVLLTPQKDAVDVLVVAGRTLGAGRHLEGAQEARDQRLQLVHVLFLGLHHAKDEAAWERERVRESEMIFRGYIQTQHLESYILLTSN